MFKKSLIVVGVLMVFLAIILAACSTPTPTATEVPPTPVPTDTVAPPPTEIPPTPTEDKAALAQADFATSAHANGDSEPFKHWDAANPAEIPTTCAKCHSEAGFVDFIQDGKVDAAVPAPGKPFSCTMCHNDTANKLSSVTFPSGAVVSNLGPEARCMTCHQGRESKVSVDKQITDFKVAEKPDEVVAPLKDGDKVTNFGFRNIHYLAAAATLYGSEVHGGYEYDSKKYDAKHAHVSVADSCIGCHNQHSLKIRLDKCAECHGDNAKDQESLKNIREPSSAMDYDGDGNKTEGVYYEIVGLQEKLLGTIQAYASEVIGTGITYDSAAYPYWFADADKDGKADQKDGKPVGYSTWTPRLLKAAYNYQTSQKDPGAFAHGGKYIVELLYDSMDDLNQADKLKTKTDLTKLSRTDAGHFDGSAEAWRHWDAATDTKPAYTVEAACVRCHSATALPMIIAGKTGEEIGMQPAGNGLLCVTCHDPANFPNRRVVDEVTFPSGKVVTFGKGEGANLCIMCHQGRESKASVDKTIASFNPTDMDAVPTPLEKDGKKTALGFKNIHYFPAGVTIFGTEAQGAYEFDGKTYVGRTQHPLNKCTDCHNVHALEPKLDECVKCHSEAGKDPETIRMTAPDYDGDGDTKESVSAEIQGLRDALGAQLKAYTKAKKLPGIVYNAAAYPYFFEDKDGDGKADKNDKGGSVSYTNWTPNLLKAAFNYQYVTKDPGAFVHNAKYVAQILIDSIEALGGNVSKFVRPEAK